MYKVDYYTLARCGEDSIGNIKKYSDTWYTENFIEDIPKALEHVVDARKGVGKYIPVITDIQNIKKGIYDWTKSQFQVENLEEQ